METTRKTADVPEIFVGCSTEGLRVAKAIQNNLQYCARVTIWSQGSFELTHNTLQDLVHSARRSDFAVFVLYPDDIVETRGSSAISPRDNTIFEAGLFMGVLGQLRVFLVVPRDVPVKLPTDLSGITTAPYRTPTDDRWEPALGPACNQIEDIVRKRGRRLSKAASPSGSSGPHHVFSSLRQAGRAITDACRGATDIKVLANKGVVFLGTDDSIISTAEIDSYSRLRKLRVLLMSPESRWISNQSTPDGTIAKGLISLRKHESLEMYVNEIKTSHEIVEAAFRQFASILTNARSGVRYFTGEPCWRMVMTDEVAFVSNYADGSVLQVRDLPVHRFDNVPGSLYTAFKRQFNDIWHNQSEPGTFMQATLDLAVSAGGIVYVDTETGRHVLLLKRHDGAWVLPKGHKKLTDRSLRDTALREVAEETGVPAEKLAVGDLLDTYTDSSYSVQGEHKVVSIFAIRYKDHALPGLNPDADHAEARWWIVSDPLPLMLYPYQVTLLAEFIEHGTKE